MKSLIFYVAAFLVVLVAGAHPVEFNKEHPKPEFIKNSIVMEDAIMMLVTADPPNGTITKIIVKSSSGQVVYSDNGCGSTSCTVNLSSLSWATYGVHVNTSSGQSFSGTVMAGS